jgi:methionine S-methyltransferase
MNHPPETHTERIDFSKLTPQLFLEHCEVSSQNTYQLFKDLLSQLQKLHQSPELIQSKVKLIYKVREYLKNQQFQSSACLEKYHFSFFDIYYPSNLNQDKFELSPSNLSSSEKNLINISRNHDTNVTDEDNIMMNPAWDNGHLCLIQFPSTFSPEEWSYTFFEGLSRYPTNEFKGKNCAELGCGNGWITLALAKKFSPQKIYGLDINPKAVTCAGLNLYLNALTPLGEWRQDLQGKTLLERVEFYQSDLGGFLEKKEIKVDILLGCIPQVLGPDPSLTTTLLNTTKVSEGESDEFLHSLSNYCAHQGLVEDQFGLGLVARAIEEGLHILNPNGKIIFNLGGRPGEKILQRLFKRRGFIIRKIWQKQVGQAQDTDILSLVDIEQNSNHRFEFYLEDNFTESISAKTAYHFQKEGGKIFHALLVFDAITSHQESLSLIFKYLRGEEDLTSEGKLLNLGIISSMDLSFEKKSVADEKILFNKTLVSLLKNLNHFGYGPQEGELFLRQTLTDFFSSYFHINLAPQNFFIAPNRVVLIQNLLLLYRPKLALISDEFTQSITSPKETTILEGISNIAGLIELILVLKPQFVVLTLTPHESLNQLGLEKIIQLSESTGFYLIIDASNTFEITSSPQHTSQNLYQLIKKYSHQHQIFWLWGLIKNQVYQNWELAFLINQNKLFNQTWKKLVDLTFCRTPFLEQVYYHALISELLNFQMPKIRGPIHILPLNHPQHPTLNSSEKYPEQKFSIPVKIFESINHDALSSESLEMTPKTLRLDYGENECRVPNFVKSNLLGAHLRQDITEEEADPTEEIKKILSKRFQFYFKADEGSFTWGQGVTPLFSCWMEYLSTLNEGTLLIPQGTYGYFLAQAEFYGVKFNSIPTTLNNSFKLVKSDIINFFKNKTSPTQTGQCWCYLNYPIVNPTGAQYTNDEIFELMEVFQQLKISVIFDTIFSGLEYQSATYNLGEILKKLKFNDFVLLGGISKEISAAGLRFGYGYTSNKNWAKILSKAPGGSPHFTLLYAVKKIFNQLLDDNSQDENLILQRKILLEHKTKLTLLLKNFGWKVLEPRGGLFLVASPEKLIGQKTKDGSTLTWENFGTLLYQKTHLLINGPQWTNINEYFRFVLSVDPIIMDKSLEALKLFHQDFTSP